MLPCDRVPPQANPSSAALLHQYLYTDLLRHACREIQALVEQPVLHRSTDDDLLRRFSRFRMEETAISDRPIEEFVRPSSSVRSPLAIMLHYKPRNTCFRANGEYLVLSAICTAWLREKGLDQSTFAMELCHRRLQVKHNNVPRRSEWSLNQSPAFGRVHNVFRIDVAAMLSGTSTCSQSLLLFHAYEPDPRQTFDRG